MLRLVMVLDRSGSMQGLETDVIGGFNAFIDEQKKLKDKAVLTTVLFDNEYQILHDNVNLHAVQPITKKEYFVRGTTALLDALGKTINRVDHQVKKKDKVLFVVNTDGLENSSKEYSNEDIKNLVEHLEKEHDWKFIFLGANIDSFSVGMNMGISSSFDFQNTGAGIRNMYAAVSNTTSSYRDSKGASIDTTALKNLDDENK